MFGVTLVSPPAVEPVSLAEAKLYVRVDSGVEDDLFTSLIAAAREYAETFTQRALITQSWLLTLDSFVYDRELNPSPFLAWYPIVGYQIYLPRPPLQQVNSVQYVDTSGTLQLVDPSLYQVDANAEPARLAPAFGKIWPIARYQTRSVQIAFQAGYGDDPSKVPDGIKTAIKVWIADRYYNRESPKSETTVDRLLWPYRVLSPN